MLRLYSQVGGFRLMFNSYRVSDRRPWLMCTVCCRVPDPRAFAALVMTINNCIRADTATYLEHVWGYHTHKYSCVRVCEK